MQPPLILDMSIKYGRLTPIRSLGRKLDNRNRRLWEFHCDCGKTVERSASTVKSGRTLSCGCLREEYSKSSLKPTLRANLAGPRRKLFGRYSREAAKRGYEFDLTFEIFSEIIKLDCFYCGSVPSTKLNISTVFTDRNVLVYNGLDRLVNTIGYTTANVVPCCIVCNRIKMVLDYDEFVKHVKKIVSHLENKNVI